MGWTDQQTGQAAALDQDVKTLHVGLCVSGFELGTAQSGTSGYKARVTLRGRVDDGDTTDIFPPTELLGPATQIAWFVRKSFSGTNLWIALVLTALLSLSALARWVMRTVLHGEPMQSAARVGMWCALLGQAYVLLLLAISPLWRQSIAFHELQTVLHYVVDTSSEIWVKPGDTNRAGPPEFALELETQLKDNTDLS